MDKCFVIQPFDSGKFDLRYADVFEPAIKKAHLEPYRVDRDPSVTIPIEQIEEGIRKSRICFAEITTDNPNIWYELGFAYASRKDVVMVCSDERQSKFPFDIQHKHIIQYTTGSITNFQELGQRISDKLVALLKKEVKVQELIETPVKDTEGLSAKEIAMILLIFENQPISDEPISIYSIQEDMDKIGYTKIATNIALKELSNKEYINTTLAESYYNDQPYPACGLTAKGVNWVLTNQDKAQLTKAISSNGTIFLGGTELPF